MAYNPVLLLLFFFFMLCTCSCLHFSVSQTRTGERGPTPEDPTEKHPRGPTPEDPTEKHPRIIGLGSLLSPKGENTSWQSSSGHFVFGFYPQGSGFAVGIWLISPSENTTTVVWTANRDAPAVSSKSMLNLTEQGLLLQNGNGDSAMNIDSRDDSDSNLVSKASMHDSGNFVLYDENSTVIWQSFDYPTDTILGGQNLTAGNHLISSISKSDHSRGCFYLGMQTDGNLVAFPLYSRFSDLDAYWASNSQDLEQLLSRHYIHAKLSLSIQGFLCLNMSEDSLCLNDINKHSKKLHNNTTSIYRATFDVDGNLRLYEHQFHFEQGNNSSRVKTLWQALNDTCQVKGFCGLNSYCSFNMSGDAVCKCYPGFIPSNTKSVPIDCVQTHSKDDCESIEDRTLLYNFTHFENMHWGDVPYSVIPVLMDMDTCEKACRQDCVCGGAIYTNGSCNKYRLPLIHGRFQNDSSSTVALIKTPSTSNNTNVPKPKVVIDNKKNLIMILSLTLGVVSLICFVTAVSIFFTYRRQVNRYAMLSESEKLGFTEECSLTSFSFDELSESTGGFSDEIGRGSFGVVYKGTIGDNNRSIAVKRLEERIVDAGDREFRTEVTAIARTHHRNLVKLIGFCIEGSNKLLVYEFVSKGSLANLLFEGEVRLSWKERMKLALDVAKGILYLHEECEVRIIHCNINPRNILMDEAWTAKISDFGLARLSKRGHSRTKIEDDGTSRYLAPEWQKEDASVSVKADIYSFGVVLLEIICRRRSIEMNNIASPDEILLSSWAYQCFEAGQLNKLIRHDEKDVDWKLLERMVKVGLWCVQDQQYLRPTMKNVILMLEGLEDIPVPPSPTRLLE